MWDAGLYTAFQALARQIHSLAVPTLDGAQLTGVFFLPGMLGPEIVLSFSVADLLKDEEWNAWEP